MIQFHHNLFVDIYWAELHTMFTGVENKNKCFCRLALFCLLADWIATLSKWEVVKGNISR